MLLGKKKPELAQLDKRLNKCLVFGKGGGEHHQGKASFFLLNKLKIKKTEGFWNNVQTSLKLRCLDEHKSFKPPVQYSGGGMMIGACFADTGPAPCSHLVENELLYRILKSNMKLPVQQLT